MTDNEYDILDELYFVASFTELQSKLALPAEMLGQELKNLIRQGFVKCLYPTPDTELAFEESAYDRDHIEYFYLATKKGLLHHNSR